MRRGNSNHPIATGACAVVFDLGKLGRPILEGHGFIVGRGKHPHHYLVRFIGERVLRTRFIDPDWQRQPATKLKMLTAFWRANTSPPFDDFFPDDTTQAEGEAP